MFGPWIECLAGRVWWPHINGRIELTPAWIVREDLEYWIAERESTGDMAARGNYVGPFPTWEAAKAAFAIIYS